MKAKTGIKAGSLMIVALPLFVAAGCAGNKQTVALSDMAQTDVVQSEVAQADVTQAEPVQTDTAQPDDTVQTAIATMDGYMARLEQQPERQADAIEGVPTETEVTPTQASVAVSTTPPNDDTASQEQVVATADEALSPAEQKAVAPLAEEDVMPPEDKGILSVPPQLVFYFDTNSVTPAASDNDMLLQHAQYLERHPNMVLMIRGHADSRGAKAYNQRLSDQRAINVATMLLAAGVSGDQLRIDGMGDDVPMADSAHWKQNRRVEFTYMDSMVAQNN